MRRGRRKKKKRRRKKKKKKKTIIPELVSHPSLITPLDQGSFKICWQSADVCFVRCLESLSLTSYYMFYSPLERKCGLLARIIKNLCLCCCAEIKASQELGKIPICDDVFFRLKNRTISLTFINAVQH